MHRRLIGVWELNSQKPRNNLHSYLDLIAFTFMPRKVFSVYISVINHVAVNFTHLPALTMQMLFDPGYVKSICSTVQGTIYCLTQVHKQSETKQLFVSKSFYG